MRQRVNGKFVQTRRAQPFQLAIVQSGLTTRQFAQKIGAAANTVGSWFAAKQSPGLVHVILIAAVLDISVDRVVELLIQSGHDFRTEPYPPGEKGSPIDRGRPRRPRLDKRVRRPRAKGSQPAS